MNISHERKFGVCPRCETKLEGVHCLLKRRDDLTGAMRYFDGIDAICCPYCFTTTAMDNSFDIEISKKSYYAMGGK